MVVTAAIAVTRARSPCRGAPALRVVAGLNPSRHGRGSCSPRHLAAITLGHRRPKQFAPAGSAATRPSTMLAMPPPRPRRCGAYRFGPVVVFWLMAVLTVAALPRCRYPPPPSTTRRPAASHRRRRDDQQPSGLAVLLHSGPPHVRGLRGSFTSPTRPCCPWSDRSLRCRTRISAPP